MKQRLSSLDCNTLVEDILLKRESQLKAMSIRRTGRSARCLEPAAIFVPWYEEYELGGHSDDNLDDIVDDPDYVDLYFQYISLCMYIFMHLMYILNVFH